MVEGPSVNRHHWTPKSKGGQVAEHIHIICHRMIHRTFSEKELADEYATPHALREHPTIISFVQWVRKKPAELIGYAKAPRNGNKRRPQKHRHS
tara:strand:- start:75 stop:356 length:282 start_codon:yes stop_codon:yes gene_type:complete